MNMNPRVAHLLLELGQYAGYVTAASSLPFISLIPNVGPYVGLAAGLAGAYLGWLKTTSIGNIPPSSK